MTTTSPSSTAPATATTTSEHEELLGTLEHHRGFLRHTIAGLTNEQAGARPTASELSIGGVVKHVTAMEAGWVRFVVEGTQAMVFDWTPEAIAAREAEFTMLPDDSVEALLAPFAEVAARTEGLIRALPDLGMSHPLPRPRGSSRAPAGQPGASCCTCSPRPRSTQATPTSSARRSTARRRWADVPIRAT